MLGFGGNYTNVPFIMEGEIIEVHSYPADTSKKIKPVRYVCRVSLPNGSEILLPNVVESTMFGGIADYLQIRHRTSKDASSGAGGALGGALSAFTGGDGYQFSASDQTNNAKVGDRVYIACINGHITRPVIIGYAQHPNQTDEFEGADQAGEKPNIIFQYNGIRATIDEEGQLTIIHKGPPEISEAEGAGAKTSGGGGVAGAAAGALASATGEVVEPKNDAVKFPENTERTLMEFLKTGIFRIRDAEGQIIEIDRVKKRIYLSNNDLKSTESAGGGALSGGLQLLTNSTDAEYLLLDKNKELALMNARKIAQIYSFDKRKDVTEGDHSHMIYGNSEWLIQGNEKQTIGGGRDTKISEDDKLLIGGNQDTTVIGDKKEKVTGAVDIQVVGDQTEKIGGSVSQQYTGSWEVIALGGIKLNGSLGKLTLADGKVALGSDAAELLDLFDQDLDAFINNASSLVFTAVGPGVLNPAVVTLLTQIKTFLTLIKGSL